MCLPNSLFPVFMFVFIFHWPSFTPCWLHLVEHSLLAASISYFLTAALTFHVLLPLKFVSFVFSLQL